MKQNTIEFSFLTYLLILFYTISLSRIFFAFEEFFLPSIIIIPIILIGEILFYIYIRKKQHTKIITKISNWFFIIFILIFNLFIILSVVLFNKGEDETVSLTRAFFQIAIVYNLISAFFISLKRPKFTSEIENENSTKMSTIILKSAFLLFMIILFFTPIIPFIYFIALKYGSDEGMTGFFLMFMIQFSLISFVPILGFGKNIKNKQTSFISLDSMFFRIIFAVLFISSLAILIATLIPIITDYHPSRDFGTFIVFYHIFSIGVFNNLFFLFSSFSRKQN